MRHLDGDQPLQLLIVGQIDEAKASLAQYLFDAVAANLLRLLRRRSVILRERIPWYVPKTEK